MPLNPFDANFFSFEQKVLPVLHQRAIAPLGMKPIGGHGEPVEKGIFTAQELLRYAMSLAVATTITGVSDLGILKQNLEVAQGFTPLPDTEMDALRKRAKPTVAFQVPKRPMGKTGLEVSIIGMGGYHLGAAAGQQEVNNMVAKALDHGINFFDNAGNITAA
jgi:aryl-alcohol dehydrogenase-like predicted oxidoreductase